MIQNSPHDHPLRFPPRRGFALLGVLTSIAILSSSRPSRGADLVLADAKVHLAPIVLYADAPPRTREAAESLVNYLDAITGQRPQLIVGEPKPIPERAIWVGYQPILKTLFPKIDFEFNHPEEILLAANENHLVIAGRDRWDPKHTQAKGRLSLKTDMQQEYGTANAVYTFLQDRLGVRWLWPGEEDFPRQARLAIAPFEYRYHPQIRARAGMFTKLSLGDNTEGQDELWTRYQRVQLDSLEIDGGHGFGEWWEKYSKTNPDFFALHPDASRRPHPNPPNTKICESNPAVWERWLADVEEQLKADPTTRLFNVSANDGYDFGHCVCEKCLAKDHPDAEKFTWRWYDKQEERPALSDRQVAFANTLARLLKKKYPDKPYYVMLLAYGYSRPAPIGAKPDDNVIIASVANFHLRGEGGEDGGSTAMKQFADWSKKSPAMFWRPNLGNPCGLSWGMPDVAPIHAAKDFRFVADHHCVGLYFDSFWFHWATQGPHYYALAHLAWDPYTDSTKLMDDYYQRAFGPAAGEVKAYWTLLEKTRMDFVNEVPSRMRVFVLPRKYTADLLSQGQAHLDAAAKRVADGDPKYRRRVAFVQCGLDYTKNLVETRAWMQKFEASKEKDEAAKAKVLACWAKAEAMKKTFPEFAINWQTAFSGGSNVRRGMGLHPNAPLSGPFLKEYLKAGIE